MKHYKTTEHSLVHNAYAFLWACGYVYGKEVVKELDWFGRKLVGLIDHSDFFAGAVVGVLISEICYFFGK